MQSTKGILLIFGLITSGLCEAQSFLTLSPEVKIGTQTLLYPWTGGLNTPQIMNVDLNQDGSQDVVIFDRSGGVWLPFIWNGRLIYSPKYKARFPRIRDWTIMKDYNQDGHADIFSYSSTPGIAGVEVYDAIPSASGLSYVKHIFQGDRSNILYYTSGNNRINAYVSSIDYPAIEDIDRDGDMDLLSYEPGGGLIIWYKNLQADKKLSKQTFDLVIGDFCFGKILEDGLSEKITLSSSKDKCASGFSPGLEVRHAGSTLLAFDRDTDRDYDLFIGDISSSGIIYLRNGGDTSSGFMDLQETGFPSNSVPVDLPYFVTPFVADINNDGIKEFFAGSNFQYGSDNYHCLWRYDRDPTNIQNYKYISNSYIVDQTLDFGEGTYPALADVTGDGLIDLVVGTGGYFDRGGIHDASLILFKNIGTARKPAFQLIDSNWLNFKLFNTDANNFAPAFGDLDADGDLDLMVGEVLGRLFYAENLAGKNKPMSFALIKREFSNIDVGQYAVPQIYDLDGDGLNDLIIGERDGVINFFKNTGSSNSPLFSTVPTIGMLGGIDTRVTGFATGYAAPLIIQSQKKRIMAVGTSAKNVILYENPMATSVGMIPIAETWGNILEGDDSHLAVADIDQDGLLDVVVGNQRGGLAWYQTNLPSDFSTKTLDMSPSISIHVYPNPAKVGAYIHTEEQFHPGIIRVFDLQGKLIRTERYDGYRMWLDLEGYVPGLYTIEVKSTKFIGRCKLIVAQ